MDSLKMKTLEQVDAALEIVEDARADQSLNDSEKHQLEIAAVELRNLERTIIKSVQKELVASLTADSGALKDLARQIKETSEKLAGVADTIHQAAAVVELFIKVITTIAATGFLL